MKTQYFEQILIVTFLLLNSYVLTAQDKFHKDDQCFADWAEAVKIDRGFVNILNPSLGKVDYGEVAYALHKADGNVVSLGDQGVAILSFSSPLVNGEGADFAVFENAFMMGKLPFLEFAFVEVSSNGLDFFRFPSVTLVPNDKQKGSFESTDPCLITNLAGNALANFGTPFDLEEMKDIPGLNINQITHVKLVDVVGSINESIASFDSKGEIINDPFPTPFNSSGFDLDALGVIHNQANQDQPPFVLVSSMAIVLNENAPAKHIDLNSVFSDPNGDELAYLVKSNSNASLLTTSISEKMLTLNLIGDQSGEAVLSIQATANGKSVSTEVVVTVNAVDDAPVIIQSISPISIDEDSPAKEINLENVFNDPDGDALVYKLISNTNESLLIVEISENLLTIRPISDQSGEAVLCIEATANGKSVSTEVVVTVNAVDDAPVLVQAISNQFVEMNNKTIIIDLTPVFSCRRGTLVYRVTENTNKQLVNTEIRNASIILSLSNDKFGEADLTVEAEANGQWVETSFTLTVNLSTGIEDLEQKMLRVYPNPCQDHFWLEMGDYNGELRVSVLNLTGRVVKSDKIQYIGRERIDMTGLPSGMYLIRVQSSEGNSVMKMLKR